MKENGNYLNLLHGVKYNHKQNPLHIQDPDLKDGINCQMLVHIELEELGFALPKWLLSKELYECRDYTDIVESNFRIGDIFFFSPDVDTQKHDLHTAILIGFDENGPVLKHITNGKKANTQAVLIWRLHEFHKDKRYQHLHGVRRVIPSIKYSKKNGDHLVEPAWFKFEE